MQKKLVSSLGSDIFHFNKEEFLKGTDETRGYGESHGGVTRAANIDIKGD